MKSTKSLRERQIEEAINRMDYLGLDERIIDEFANGTVKQIRPVANALYAIADVENNQKITEEIKRFEDKFKGLVYHVITDDYRFGDGSTIRMSSFLYVSAHEEEWELDREDMRDGRMYAYVFNHPEPDCSEIGMIGIFNSNGFLLRNDRGFDFESIQDHYIPDQAELS